MVLKLCLYRNDYNKAEDFTDLIKTMLGDRPVSASYPLNELRQVHVDLTQETFNKICEYRNVWSPAFVIRNDGSHCLEQRENNETLPIAWIYDRQNHGQAIYVHGSTEEEMGKALSEYIRNFTKIEMIDRFRAEVEENYRRRDQQLAIDFAGFENRIAKRLEQFIANSEMSRMRESSAIEGHRISMMQKVAKQREEDAELKAASNAGVVSLAPTPAQTDQDNITILMHTLKMCQEQCTKEQKRTEEYRQDGLRLVRHCNDMNKEIQGLHDEIKALKEENAELKEKLSANQEVSMAE